VTSLIGPNGAGKTTVQNLLGGFVMPDSGTVTLGGVRIERLPAWRIARAGVARTYQTSQLFGSLSVLENLLIASPERSGTEAAAQRLLAFIGYRGDLNAPAAELAHVDRRLVEIARALATRPAVLLLDEPAAGLSREDKSALSVLLRRIADSGVTVVLVEHDMPVVMSISDRIVVLDAGMEIAAGAPAEVQRNPAVRSAYLGEDGERQARHRVRDANTGEALLDVSGLRAGYGAQPVLKGMDLQIREGEFVAALGANGAGKSTLMHALCGLLRPVSGNVSFGGVDLSRLPAHRVAAQGVVLVPEGRQVFPELSVLDNIRLGGYLRKHLPESEIERVLEGFPKLRQRLHQRAGLLSGGEQQMLAIARGLMARPRLLLLDEPSLGLAPNIIGDLFHALDLLRDAEVTILLVDQMAGLALALADRAYVIERGRIVAAGSGAAIAADGALEKAYLGVQ
jgi:ABC-type branched-subunit amino acid transport system ATPase component